MPTSSKPLHPPAPTNRRNGILASLALTLALYGGFSLAIPAAARAPAGDLGARTTRAEQQLLGTASPRP